MKYLLLIYDDEKQWATMSPEEGSQAMKEYFEYTAWLQEKGWFQGGEPLQPTASATTVRIHDGERLITDGPFAETKEQLGGYYLIECQSLDDAIEAAAKLPNRGSVEVRPLMEIPEQPPAGG